MVDKAATDAKAPFQIRDFLVATRELGKTCAHKSGLTMAEWADRAFHTQARVDRNEQVIFAPPKQAHPEDAARDAALADLLTAAGAATSHDPRGIKAVPGLVSLLAARVRAAKGLPPLPPRKTPVKQMLQIGKTPRQMPGHTNGLARIGERADGR